MRHELERVEIPGEHEARERAWSVVAREFDERTPTPQRSHWPRVAAVAIALAALLGAAFSPPGQAVIDEIREVVGVERAERALFSLPSEGRLLVSSDAGVWVVQHDGSKRLLGPYREASWSPFGRYVVAARRDELAALESDGEVRWSLARPQVRSPRWTGSETDTRIAYVDRTGIRVVAGDGTDDRLLAPGAQGPLAWRPGAAFVLAYADRRGRIVLVDTRSGDVLWRIEPDGRVRELEWSSDGRRLRAHRAGSRNDVVVYTGAGAPFTGVRTPRGAVTAEAVRPGSHGSALATSERGQARLTVTGAGVPLLSGPGVFEDVAWSPNGAWVLVSWPLADQWVFVRASGARRVRAVSNISGQFRSRTFPRVEGWCCAP